MIIRNIMFLLLPFLASACVHDDFESAAASGSNHCPGFQKFADSVPTEGKLTIKHLSKDYEFVAKNQDCDEGIYSSTHSDIVTRAVTSDTANSLAAMDGNKGLKEFVLKHVDASADISDLELGLKNVRAACLKKKYASCDLLETEFNEAIRVGNGS